VTQVLGADIAALVAASSAQEGPQALPHAPMTYSGRCKVAPVSIVVRQRVYVPSWLIKRSSIGVCCNCHVGLIGGQCWDGRQQHWVALACACNLHHRCTIVQRNSAGCLCRQCRRESAARAPAAIHE
jgi:hypothetical protein